MAIPVGYVMTPSGFYARSTDNSIGYSIDSAGVATFLGGTLVSATSAGYSQGPTGFWYGSDASGPFFRDGSGQIFTV